MEMMPFCSCGPNTNLRIVAPVIGQKCLTCGKEKTYDYAVVMPWHLPDLQTWDIVCINHYHVDGKRMIYVALSKDGKLIKEEGEDNQEIWRKLRKKAI